MAKKRDPGGGLQQTSSQKEERAASIPVITTEIEMLREMKLKICVKESEMEREKGVSWLLIITVPRVTLISTCHRQGAYEPVDGKVR